MTSLKLLCTNQEDWVQFIAPVLFSYRASVAIPLGMSPFQALFGRQMTLGIDLNLLNECETAPTTSAFISDLASKLRITHDIVKSNMKDSAQRSKTFYDVNTKTPEITVGSKVLLHNDTVKPGQSPKFLKVWSGPYLVIAKSDDGLLYTLRHCDTGKQPRAAVHANRLKLYNDDRDAFYLRHNITPRHISRSQNTPQSNSSSPQPVLTQPTDGEWYAIDGLLNHKKVGKTNYYLVKWQDAKGSQTWEPENNVTQFAIDQYLVTKRQKAERKKQRRFR